MNFYQFAPNDQPWNNWLVSEEVGKEAVLRVRERYRGIVCSRCKKFDHDKAFDLGFDADIRIRARGDIVCTSDNLYCITERRGIKSERRSEGV